MLALVLLERLYATKSIRLQHWRSEQHTNTPQSIDVDSKNRRREHAKGGHLSSKGACEVGITAAPLSGTLPTYPLARAPRRAPAK